MQYFLNGYRKGDPRIRPAADGRTDDQPELPGEVDVLIVGTGPAGLLLAAQLSEFPDIVTRVVERAPGPLEVGRADGVSCKTVETFEAFGLAERMTAEAYWVNQTTFWGPDPDNPSRIKRFGRVQDVRDGLSEFPHVIVNQARLGDFLLEYARNSPSRLKVDYHHEVVALQAPKTDDEPVLVTIRRGGDDTEITVEAKYVVGCDGAHSTVRESIGRIPHGAGHDKAWGVMDILAVTDFPDIRFKATIQSGSGGNILLIPREGGYLVRLYVDMGEIAADAWLTPDDILDQARRVLAPYTLEVQEIAWFSVYRVGHRVTDRFDDVDDDKVGTRSPRVFIAGDACHTHTAKAGQGMNVSMQDTFNLGWKLAAVLQGRSPAALLDTYSLERKKIAEDLIDDGHPVVAGDRRSRAGRLGRPQGGHGRIRRGPAPVRQQRRVHRRTGHAATLPGCSPATTPISTWRPATHRDAGSSRPRSSASATPSASTSGTCTAPTAGGGSTPSPTPSTPAPAGRGSSNWSSSSRAMTRRSAASRRRATTSTGSSTSAASSSSPTWTSTGRTCTTSSSRARASSVSWTTRRCSHRSTTSTRTSSTCAAIDRGAGALVVVRPDQHVSLVLPLDGYDELAEFFGRFMKGEAG